MGSIPVRIELFGHLRIAANGSVPSDLAPTGAAALLAYLALHPGRTHPREQLFTLFWPKDDPEQAGRKLRQALYSLRKLLEQAEAGAVLLVEASRSSVRLNGSAVRTDLQDFELSLNEARRTPDAEQRAHVLAEALERCSGELLPGFYQECFVAERDRWAESRRSALGLLIQAYEQAGDWGRAIDAAHHAIALNPLAEEAHCELMRLYAARGEPSAVLRQYRELERTLQEEIGEAPSAATRSVMEDLRREAQENLAARGVAREAPGPLVPLETSRRVERSAVEEPRPLKPPAPAAPPAPSPDLSWSLGWRRWARPAFGVTLAAVLGFFGGQWSGQPARPAGIATWSPAGWVGGKRLWVQRYARQPGDANSEATAIAVDGSGNVYVTGFIQTAAHDVDYLTLKYSPSGAQLWERRYNGPGNDVDRARSLAVDAAGNVYVTGDSFGLRGNGKRLSELDFATIKYAPDGRELWVRRWDSTTHGADMAVAVSVDAAGDVYVTGGSWNGDRRERGTSTDYVTLKYSPAGEKLWAKRLDVAGDDDIPTDLLVDADGFATVTGTSRCDLSGKHGWDLDFLTLRYDPQGRLLWKATFNGRANGDDTAPQLASGPSGDLYVGGTAENGEPAMGGTFSDFVIVRYDRRGNEKWVAAYDGPESGPDRLQDFAVGQDGVVYAGGETMARPGWTDMAIVSFDPLGRRRWDRTLNGTGSRWDAARAVGVDAHGSLRVAGSTFNRESGPAGGSDSDYTLLRYAPDGALRWLRTLPTAARGADIPAALALDPGGNSLVTGQGWSGETADIVTMKYSP